MACGHENKEKGTKMPKDGCGKKPASAPKTPKSPKKK